MDDKLREEILEKAHEILNDETLLRALIEASDKNLGNKIVDLRSVAMKKMDGELKKTQKIQPAGYRNSVWKFGWDETSPSSRIEVARAK